MSIAQVSGLSRGSKCLFNLLSLATPTWEHRPLNPNPKLDAFLDGYLTVGPARLQFHSSVSRLERYFSSSLSFRRAVDSGKAEWMRLSRRILGGFPAEDQQSATTTFGRLQQKAAEKYAKSLRVQKGRGHSARRKRVRQKIRNICKKDYRQFAFK